MQTGLQKEEKRVRILVIVDIFMPEKNGLEVIKEIKPDFPDVRIIAISGIDIKDRVEMTALTSLCGTFRLLEKPFSQAELLTAVRDVLA